ncbi:MAG: DUF1990 domain-containing protein [Bacteroidetes bacterium]|nr:DUF1990 domain-containing protein [Bacteroidota bacterium]
MKVYLKNQSKKFSHHLNRLKHEPIKAYNKRELREVNSQIVLDLRFEEIDTSLFFDYRVFPSKIMTYLSQWQLEEREILKGDTILQQIYFPSFDWFSMKIVAGVRIKSVLKETERVSFSYETLEGHIENGCSEFILEKIGDVVYFRIKTFSKPGNFLVRLTAVLFAIPYQKYCTKSAMLQVKNLLESNRIHL